MKKAQLNLTERMIGRAIDLMIERYDAQEVAWHSLEGAPSPDLKDLAEEAKKVIFKDIELLEECISQCIGEAIDSEVESANFRCGVILKEGNLADIYKEVEMLGEFLKQKINAV